jgi:hypothetical protein
VESIKIGDRADRAEDLYQRARPEISMAYANAFL